MSGTTTGTGVIDGEPATVGAHILVFVSYPFAGLIKFQRGGPRSPLLILLLWTLSVPVLVLWEVMALCLIVGSVVLTGVMLIPVLGLTIVIPVAARPIVALLRPVTRSG